MISRRSRTVSAAAALFTAVALGVPAAAQAAAPAPPAGSGATPAAAPTVTPVGAGTAGSAAAVTLPTGDRVVVGTGANPGVAVDSGSGGSDAFANFTVGGDRYVVPSEAAPYAGRQLGLSLFDVTKLAAAAPDAAAHIPVQLQFAAGVTPTAPAGVTLTSVSGQNATGYLTPGSGKAFAQALRDSIKADLAAGKPAGTGALFGGLTSMAALGTSAPVQPHYPLHILQLNTLDGTGAPSNTLVILIDTDNVRVFDGQVASYQGIAKVAVPAGNYAAISIDFIYNDQAGTVRTNFVSEDGITVPATGPVPPATIDERTATSPITFTTQKPSTEVAGTVQIIRVDPNGVAGGLGTLTGPGDSVYVSPEAKPATGALNYSVDWVGQSPATAASPYRYNLGVIADQISANQSYAPTDSSLATLHHTFSLDPAFGTNLPSVGSGFVDPYGYGLTMLPATGGSATEYVTGGLDWLTQAALPAVPNSSPTGPPAFALLGDDARTLTAGQSVTRNWGQAPIAPNFGQHTAGPNLFNCQACVGAGNLNVTLGMLGDSNRDTSGLDFGAAGSSQLYWNGTLVSSDTNHFGYTLQNIPAGPATVRTVFDFDRSATGISQSTKTHTDVTIPYSGQSDPRLALPSTVPCVPAEAAGTPAAPCQILPALTLNYQLNGLDNRDTSHSPVQTLLLSVGHVSYGGYGSHAAIDSAKVSVSYDNGATWKDVPTYGFAGTYAAYWANPKAGSPVELRVTATDRLGGSITQTVTNPYTVG
ncbi:hypothetical protein KGQ19_39945 [Catenulispora sp. NL8]|uniref:Peptidase S8 and S53 subtilisin kexin sedolisin n=2 Tax=Catenulispora pinistramenti TaxID=2705254 RepID=A0ABS5L3V1_9ACTN|nr:hypothetical protein [Catenulispora pinistramenti]MBS2553043.1 hypothetical protein [Catenulispora pinistramenti]